MEPLAGIPAEFVGLGGGGGLLAALVYIVNKFMTRQADTADKMAETMGKLASAQVEHNEKSTSLSDQLGVINETTGQHSLALATLIKRSQHWPQAAGGDDD